jgi:symplekin
MDVDEEKATYIDDLLEKVADLLNEASLSSKESVKLTNLKHVQEIILNKCPTLLDNFLEVLISVYL